MPLPLFADCSAPIPPTLIAEALVSAEVAWVEREVTRFQAEIGRAEAMVPCLSESVSPETAARYHQMKALAAVAAGDRVGATARLRAVQTTLPTAVFDEKVAPPGALVERLFGEARTLGPSPRSPVGINPGQSLRMDGRVAGSRPIEVPALVQVFDEKGGPVASFDLAPESVWPELPMSRTVAGGVAEYPSEKPKERAEVDQGSGPKRGPKVVPTVATGLSLGAAIGFAAWGMAEEKKFAEPATSHEDAAQAATRTRYLAGATALSALSAAGCGVWMVIEW